MSDHLGDRMKRYERPWAQVLPPNSWALVRVDGRAFHTWARRADRPFDARIHAAMVDACGALARDIGGFRLAYTQSDEATFLFTDTTTHDSQLWFGGEVAKIVSIAAAGFTAHFNHAFARRTVRSANVDVLTPWWEPPGPAMFDARVFTMPADDAANAFVWRQRDWERNSLQMLARHHYSHRDLHGKGRADLHEMLHEVGVNWADLPPVWKNGTFLHRAPSDPAAGETRLDMSNDKHDWASINAMAGIEA